MNKHVYFSKGDIFRFEDGLVGVCLHGSNLRRRTVLVAPVSEVASEEEAGPFAPVVAFEGKLLKVNTRGLMAKSRPHMVECHGTLSAGALRQVELAYLVSVGAVDLVNDLREKLLEQKRKERAAK
jgi:hypothetical protein